MKRALVVLLLVGSFVGLLEALALRGIVVPFFSDLLLPGILAAMGAEDSGWRTEGDAVASGPVSTSIECMFNVAIYSVLTCLILEGIRSVRRSAVSK